MKTSAFLGVLAIAPLAAGQSQFLNLNFEQATIIPSSAGAPLVVATSALPRWTAYIGGRSIDDIVYDSLSLGSPIVSIHDSASPFQHPLSGSYSLVLQHSGVDATSASIGQSGQVPGGSVSIMFDSVNFQNLQVTFSGNVLPLVLVDSNPNYATVGADISSFASQSGELRFTGLSISPVVLDDIRFSTVAVPEPGVWSLLGAGGVIFLLRVCASVKRVGPRIMTVQSF